MSARLNFAPIRPISWKGKTFGQITSSIRKNNPVLNANPKMNLFLPNPLKIYRRDLSGNSTCNPRTSLSIDQLNRPNGSIVNSKATNKYGLVNTLDINLPNSEYDTNGCLKDTDQKNKTCLSQANNALRRVRSAGMIKRQFDISKNNDSYYTSRSQYLVGRNKTFQQNQYNFIRTGDVSVKPGTNASQQNVYSANGTAHCKKYFIGSNASFNYIWIDGSSHNVAVPSDYYAIDDLNGLLKSAMLKNYHYFINSFNNAKIFLLNITYNLTNRVVELQTHVCDPAVFNPNSQYSIPYNIISFRPIVYYFNYPTQAVVPGFQISNAALQTAIGFTAGYYPAAYINNPSNTVQTLTNQSFYSSFSPGIKPFYQPIYYKPSNPQFAQQGGVSSGALISRKKYDAITKDSALYRNGMGVSVSNTIAYGVGEYGYTHKDKMGYPNKSTPKFSKYSDTYKKCDTCKK